MAKIKIPFTGKKLEMAIPIYDKHQKARGISDKVKREYLAKLEQLDQSRKETHDALEILGRTQLEVMEGGLKRFVMQLSRIEDVKLIQLDSTPLPGDRFSFGESVDELKEVDFGRIEDIAAIAGAGGVGASVAAVTYAAVGTFATASTGTAISTLAGAAASNATLAFLGGGSLASGGLGVAAGTAVLGGLVVVPALAVGGFYFNHKANVALRRAEENREKLKPFIEESDQAIAILDEIRTKSTKLRYLMLELAGRLENSIPSLKDIIDRNVKGNLVQRGYHCAKKIVGALLLKLGFQPCDWLTREARVSVSRFKTDDRQVTMDIINLAYVVKSIADANMINDEGTVPPEIDELIRKGEDLLVAMSVMR